jgi:hypothetical protein
MGYLYTIEFCSAMKSNEILLFPSKWMELENIILSEVSQAQKTKNHMFSIICNFRSKANTAMLLYLSHMTRGEHIQEYGIGRKSKTWKCLMSPLQRS